MMLKQCIFILFQLGMTEADRYVGARILCAAEKVTDCNHEWSFLTTDEMWTTDYNNVEFLCSYNI